LPIRTGIASLKNGALNQYDSTFGIGVKDEGCPTCYREFTCGEFSSPKGSGLSEGAIIGIAVGCSLGGIFIISLFVAFCCCGCCGETEIRETNTGFNFSPEQSVQMARVGRS